MPNLRKPRKFKLQDDLTSGEYSLTFGVSEVRLVQCGRGINLYDNEIPKLIAWLQSIEKYRQHLKRKGSEYGSQE